MKPDNKTCTRECNNENDQQAVKFAKNRADNEFRTDFESQCPILEREDPINRTIVGDKKQGYVQTPTMILDYICIT